MKNIFPIFFAMVMGSGVYAATPHVTPPDDVVVTGDCNLTCRCTGDECFWMSWDSMCSGGAFCEADQDKYECSPHTKQQKLDGQCWELKPDPPKPPRA